MATIKTELQLEDLPTEHPIRSKPSFAEPRANSSLPHPASVPQLPQEAYQHVFSAREWGRAPQASEAQPISAVTDAQFRPEEIEDRDNQTTVQDPRVAQPSAQQMAQPAQQVVQTTPSPQRGTQAAGSHRISKRRRRDPRTNAVDMGEHALQDYQLQLMLLQKHKRLRQEMQQEQLQRSQQ